MPNIQFISFKYSRFDQLKEGLEYLKKEESRRATGPLAFVKENIATFMDAEETLTGTSLGVNQRARLHEVTRCYTPQGSWSTRKSQKDRQLIATDMCNMAFVRNVRVLSYLRNMLMWFPINSLRVPSLNWNTNKIVFFYLSSFTFFYLSVFNKVMEM